MKNRPAKKSKTPAEIKAALARGGFKSTKLTKVVPPKTVEVNKRAIKKTAQAKEARKAKKVVVPKKYNNALRKFGLGTAQKTIKRRGRYYAGAGVFQIQKHKLKTRNRAPEVQNVYGWEPSDKKGWFVVYKNGEAQPKLARYKDVKRAQNAAFRKEKIRVVAEKTGLSQKAVKGIISEIRREESKTLKRFRKTKKYKKLSASERRRLTVNNRVVAVFGALCDFLGVYGSGQTSPDEEEKLKTGKRAKNGKKARKVSSVRHRNSKPSRGRARVPSPGRKRRGRR